MKPLIIIIFSLFALAAIGQENEIASSRVPVAVRLKARAWSSHYDSVNAVWFVNVSKPGDYTFYAGQMQIRFDSTGRIMSYALTGSQVKIPLPVINSFEKYYHSVTDIAWFDGGVSWIDDDSDTLGGHYFVSFYNATDKLKDSLFNVEFDSLGNKYRSTINIELIDGSLLPAGIHTYMTKHYPRSYKYNCLYMDDTMPQYKRYITNLDVFMNGDGAVQQYRFYFEVDKFFFLQSTCYMSFNRNGDFVGKSNHRTFIPRRQHYISVE